MWAHRRASISRRLRALRVQASSAVQVLISTMVLGLVHKHTSVTHESRVCFVYAPWLYRVITRGRSGSTSPCSGADTSSRYNAYPIVARRVLARFEASLSRLMIVNIFEPEEPAGAAPPIVPAEPGGTAARGSRRGARGAGAKTARDPIGVWTICFGGDKEPTGAGLKQGAK